MRTPWGEVSVVGFDLSWGSIYEKAERCKE